MYKVLLVDDEDIIKIGLKTIIDWEKYGFCITGSANDGLQALKKVEEIQPDVVITDLIMPVMDGLELIKELKRRQYDGLLVVLSNYGDIGHVKEALRLGVEDYILKISYNQEEFEKLLLHLSERLKNRVSGSRKDIDCSLERKLQNYLLSEDDTLGNQKVYYQMILIELSEQVFQLDSSRYQQMFQKIKTILEEVLKNKQGLEVFQIKKGTIAVIFETGQEQIDEKNIIPDKIKKILSMYLMVQETILFAWNINGKQELKREFISIRERLCISFYDNVCLPEKEAKINSIHELVNPIQASNKFIGYVKEQEYERLHNELQMIILNFQENWIDPMELKDFFGRIIMGIQMYFYDKHHYEILKGVLVKIKEARHVTQLNEIVNQMIDEILDHSIRASQQGDIELAERIKQYVDSNIKDKMSLNDIASEFGFHPNYVSTYFKKRTGQTLTYYINSQKMKYAKTLLEQKELKVKEISEQVGYDDPLYFSRCFKKFFGYAPSKREEN